MSNELTINGTRIDVSKLDADQTATASRLLELNARRAALQTDLRELEFLIESYASPLVASAEESGAVLPEDEPEDADPAPRRGWFSRR